MNRQQEIVRLRVSLLSDNLRACLKFIKTVLRPFQIALIVTVMVTLAALVSAQKKSSCTECHIKLDDSRLSAPAKLFDNDIHKSRGLSCNDCHGGDPNAETKESAKNPQKGYLGKPQRCEFDEEIQSLTPGRSGT